MIWRDENFPWDNLSQKWTGNDAGNGGIVGRENRESRNNIFTFSKPHSPKKKKLTVILSSDFYQLVVRNEWT